MTLHNHINFFSQRKVFVIIFYLIIIFFISYIAVFSLGTENRSDDLHNIRYSYTSHKITLSSAVHWKKADSINEVKKESEGNYLYLKANLPDTTHDKLMLHTFNGTATIKIAEKEVFNNIDRERLSGSSYITVPLDEKMSGKTVEILLFSPLSDDFDVRIIPDSQTVYSFSNLPFAFFYIVAVIFITLIISLLFFLFTKKNDAKLPTCLSLVSILAALGIFCLEYSFVFGNAPFLFNLKLFLYLLIPILIIIEYALKFNSWNTKLETVLSVNILYAFCILCLGRNIFFLMLIYSGVFLQAVNFLFAINIISKHGKPIKDSYGAAYIAFWCINLLLWAFIALHKVFWQPISFVTTVLLYSASSIFCYYSENKKEFNFVSFFKRNDNYEDIENAKAHSVIKNSRIDVHETATDSADVIIKNDLKIPENSFSAFVDFNNMIMKKIYGKDSHSVNVSEYSRVISYSMGMSKSTSNEISKAAALHDIGKICIPENILFRTDKLSKEEFEEIKKHNIYGYQLLNSNDDAFFKMAALVAKEHHEHIDGSGYIGLKGSEISIPAKIVAVADVFDALVSKRSYKKPWSFDEAVSYICEHNTDYFDKDVVDAFMRAKDSIFDLYKSLNNQNH